MFDRVDHDMSRLIKEAVFKAKAEILRRKSESLKISGEIFRGEKLIINGTTDNGAAVVV
jgi:hypothetical protein